MKPIAGVGSAGGAASYDARFYGELTEGSVRAARRIVPLVMRLLEPRSIIDVGCGSGAWLSVFRDAGVETILGLDGPWVDADQLLIPKDRFAVRDLSKPVSVDGTFDLAISVEVGEHLPADAADGFVASLSRLAPAVLFSAAVPGQRGRDHLNEQWPDYWVRRFEAHGFVAIDALRPAIWDDPEVDFWYAQNALLLVRPDHLAAHPELAQMERVPARMLRLVHPRMWLDRDRGHRRPLWLRAPAWRRR